MTISLHFLSSFQTLQRQRLYHHDHRHYYWTPGLTVTANRPPVAAAIVLIADLSPATVPPVRGWARPFLLRHRGREREVTPLGSVSEEEETRGDAADREGQE